MVKLLTDEEDIGQKTLWADTLKQSEFVAFSSKYPQTMMEKWLYQEFLLDLVTRPSLARACILKKMYLDCNRVSHLNLAKFCAYPVNLRKILSSEHKNLMIVVGDENKGVFSLCPKGGDVYYFCYGPHDVHMIQMLALSTLTFVWGDTEVKFLQENDMTKGAPLLSYSDDVWFGILPCGHSCENTIKPIKTDETNCMCSFIRILVLICKSTDGRLASGPVMQRDQELRLAMKQTLLSKGLTLPEINEPETPEARAGNSWENALREFNSV